MFTGRKAPIGWKGIAMAGSEGDMGFRGQQVGLGHKKF